MSELSSVADQLSFLCISFQKGSCILKPQHLRRVDKSLTCLEAFFSSHLLDQARCWMEAYDGLRVLSDRRKEFLEKNSLIEEMKKKQEEHQKQMGNWLLLNDLERSRMFVMTDMVRDLFSSEDFRSGFGTTCFLRRICSITTFDSFCRKYGLCVVVCEAL